MRLQFAQPGDKLATALDALLESRLAGGLFLENAGDPTPLGGAIARRYDMPLLPINVADLIGRESLPGVSPRLESLASFFGAQESVLGMMQATAPPDGALLEEHCFGEARASAAIDTALDVLRAHGDASTNAQVSLLRLQPFGLYAVHAVSANHRWVVPALPRDGMLGLENYTMYSEPEFVACVNRSLEEMGISDEGGN